MPFSIRAAAALRLLVALFVLGFVLSWPWTGFAATFGAWAGTPTARIVVPLLGFVAVAALGGGRSRPLFRLVAAACLGVVWCTHRVLTMGDGHWWRVATADGTVGYSEPLSSLVHALLYRAFGGEVLEWVSPVAGVAATWAWLTATDALLVPANASTVVVRTVRLLAALGWASCGACALFFHRYVEHTQLGLGLMVLGVARLSGWCRDVAASSAPSQVPTRGFVVGTALATLATLCHLVYGAALFASLAAVAIAVAPGRGARRLAADASLVLGTVLALVGLTVAAFAVAPVAFVVGSVKGGGDGRYWVPFVGADGSWFAPGTLLAADHLALVAHLVVVGAPLLVPLAIAWLAPRVRASTPAHALAPLATAAAWLAYVLVYGFDLGWPNDADLMFALSPPATLLALVVAAPIAATGGRAVRALLVGLACVGATSTWCVIAPLVRPIDARLSAANSFAAALFVEGFEEAGAVGPFRVSAAIGQEVTLRAEGTPGTVFLVGRGAPSPACQGHPYGGVLDIEVSNAIQPEELIFGGVFDASGVARTTWTIAPLPDGRMPGVQMVVLQPAPGRTSAAYYFEPR